MTLLERLKPQPRWKHADPAVRLEALKDLNDPRELAVLAEADADPRVRRAAVARVGDPAVLASIVGADQDGETCERALDRLVGLASQPGPSEDVALAAVRLIGDQRRLSTIAKSDASDRVRIEALARITEERALGNIARHAKTEAVAAAALSRLVDSPELVEIALRSDHRDVALAAFDRVAAAQPDLALLRSIETRTQQKAVSRKARTMIQDIEHAEVARQAAIEERRRRETALCEAVELVAAITDLSNARAELGRVVGAWNAWRSNGEVDASAVDRFTTGVTAAEAAIVRRQREADEAADLQRMRAETTATRQALLERVQTVDGEDALEQLVSIEEEWRSLLPLVGNGPEADRLAERFAQAVAACRKRHEMGTVLAQQRVSLTALVEEAEGLLSQADGTATSRRWHELSREARGVTALLEDAARPAADLRARLDAVGAAFAAREAARRQDEQAAVEKARQEALAQLRRLAERARRAAEADTITLREGERLIKDITAGLDLAAASPGSSDIAEATGRLRGYQEQIAPRVRELREMDEWRRFANAQRQEQLIAMAEAIVGSLKADDEATRTPDLAATARALRELHAKWHEVAEAPRQSAQRLWDRFRTATDFIRARCEPYFNKLREERETSQQKKLDIVTEAEALAASTDWVKAAARFQELQTEWTAGGGAVRENGRELSQRFRAACNTFFSRRREDLADRKKVWSDNLARKQALCERAEALAASTEWDAAAAEMKQMQNDWKTVGPVRRTKSDAVWNRFRAAADAFFERYHHRHEIALSSKLAEREAMVVDLEALVADSSPSDLAERVQQLRTTWNRSVPIPAPGMKPLAARWQIALSRLIELQPAAFAGTDLDPAAVIERMKKLVARVESHLGDMHESDQGLSATELLAARLRNALASNAMGGRATEDSKLRAAADAVRDAQAAWQRLTPTWTPETRALDSRFRDACRRLTEHARRAGAPQQHRSHERSRAAV